MHDCRKLFTKRIKDVNCKKKNMKKKVILTKKAPLPIGPYNQAIQVDNLLFIYFL